MTVMTVMTVTGPVDADSLGPVLCHEHIFIDLYSIYQPHRDMYLHDASLAADEVAQFAAQGGGTIVDLTTPDIGRRPKALKQVSEATGLNVVMGTGRYRAPFYEAAIDQRPTSQIFEEFLDDIDTGCDGVRPGVIGEIGT